MSKSVCEPVRELICMTCGSISDGHYLDEGWGCFSYDPENYSTMLFRLGSHRIKGHESKALDEIYILCELCTKKIFDFIGELRADEYYYKHCHERLAKNIDQSGPKLVTDERFDTEMNIVFLKEKLREKEGVK